MNEQKLNEAADKICSVRFGTMQGMVKYGDVYIQGILAGAHWHEQQNPWRKVEDELPKISHNGNIFDNSELIK